MTRTLSTGTDTHRRSKVARNRRLFLEQLEGREVMAADSLPALLPQPLELSTTIDAVDLQSYLDQSAAAYAQPTVGTVDLGAVDTGVFGIALPAAYLSPKVNDALSQTGYFYDQLQTTGDAKFASRAGGTQVRDNKVLIEAQTVGSVTQLAKELIGLGADVAAMEGFSVSAWVPLGRVRELASLPNLRFADVSYAPFLSYGVTTTQGNLSMLAQDIRNRFGVDGTGVKIGIISDSFDKNANAYLGDVAAGDLPGPGNPNGYTTGVVRLVDNASGTDEGRAMAQIIHDLAPKAEIWFYSGTTAGITGMKAAMTALTPRVNIMIDDVGWFASPMFQDGELAQKVDSIVAAGKMYISAAGNDGKNSYEASSFVNSGNTMSYTRTSGSVTNVPTHEFGSIDDRQTIRIPAGEKITIAFQWDDPFLMTSTGSPGASQDFDIQLCSTNTTTPLTSLINGVSTLAAGRTNNIGGNPFEIIEYYNDPTVTGGLVDADLIITRVSGSSAARLKYVLSSKGSSASIQEYQTFSGTSYGHANAAGAIAVGASNYTNTPASSPPVLDSTSSSGQVPILRNLAGNPITPVVRDTPDIVATSNGNTSFFGMDDPLDADAFPNFPGTSAAAPHMGAIFALLKQSFPTATNSQLTSAVYNTATNMDAPGYDYNTGYGFANGVEAWFNLFTPGAPRLASYTDNGVSTTDGVTSLNVVDITGTAIAGSYVQLLSVGGTFLAGQQLSAGQSIYTFSNIGIASNITHQFRVSLKNTATSPTASQMSGVLNIHNDALANTVPPVVPDLETASDNGVFTNDNVTTNTTPTFSGNVDPSAAGSKVTLYIDGNYAGFHQLPVGSTAYSINTAMAVDGYHTVTMKTQMNTNAPLSSYYASPGLQYFMDTGIAPVATITPVSPDPRNTTVDQIAIQFSRPVVNFGVSDLALALNSGSNRLTFATSNKVGMITYADGRSFVLFGLINTTMAAGNYSLTFTASGSGVISAGAMVAASSNSVESWIQGSSGSNQNSSRYLDVNNDTLVNGADDTAWGNGTGKRDTNGDGVITQDDRDAINYFLLNNYDDGPY